VFKIIMMARRRPDLNALSEDDWVRFYENKRVPHAARLVRAGVLKRYVDHRRYYPFREDPINLNLTPYMDFDIVTAGTYVSREGWDQVMTSVQGDNRAVLYDDESQPFDLESRRYVYVDERLSGERTKEAIDSRFKLFVFATRDVAHRTLSHDDFIDLFETRAVPLLADAVIRSGAAPLVDFRRNYVRKSEPMSMNFIATLNADVILELGFQSREDFIRFNAASVAGGARAAYSKMLDPTSRRFIATREYRGGIPTIDDPA
jgi:hypothetical protein